MRMPLAACSCAVVAASCGGRIDDGGPSGAHVAALDAITTVQAVHGAMLDRAGPQVVPTTPSEPVSRPQRAAVAPAAPAPRPVDALLRGLDLVVDRSCVSTERAADGDGDGVPARYVVTFACEPLPGEPTSTVLGRVIVADRDDSREGATLIARFEGFSVHRRTAGGESTLVLDGEAHLTRDDTGAFVVAQRIRVGVTRTRPGEGRLAGTFAGQTTARYRPDDPARPFESGQLAGEGAAGLVHDGEARPVRIAFGPLAWNAGCRERANAAQGFDEGAVRIEGTRGGSILLTYAGCEAQARVR